MKEIMRSCTLLAFLPFLLEAKLLQRTVDIVEHGTAYTQTVTFDFDEKLLTIDVPAHNNIVQSRTMFDFNQGMMVEAQPWIQHCYLKEMPENMPTMEQMLKGLTKRENGPFNATNAKVVKKVFGHYEEINPTVLGHDDLIKECEDYTVVRVSQLDHDLPTMKVSPMQAADSFSDTAGCEFHGECIYQTCQYGTDSCFWTVTCSANDEWCDDMVHNQNFHDNDTPIHCEMCFNTQCHNDNYNCKYDWEHNCDAGAELDHKLPECSNDADLGNDCGAPRCDDPNTIPADHWKGNQGNRDSPGTFDCPQDEDHIGYVLAGNMCIFTCGDGRNGGFVRCEDDGGSYQDMTKC